MKAEIAWVCTSRCPRLHPQDSKSSSPHRPLGQPPLLAACGGGPPAAPARARIRAAREKSEHQQHIGTARKLRDELGTLRAGFPEGYRLDYHEVPGTGHQLPAEPRTQCFRWMADFRRDPLPRAVVWEHFDPPRYATHKTFHYWLAVDEPADGMRIEARWTGENQVDVKAAGTTRLTVLLNDRLADLAKPVVVKVNGREAFRGAVPPSLSAIVESLDAKEDPKLLFTARVDLAW